MSDHKVLLLRAAAALLVAIAGSILRGLQNVKVPRGVIAGIVMIAFIGTSLLAYYSFS